MRVMVEQQRSGNQQIPGYQILARLGSGAMATVFKARQLSLDREVAIKVLPKRFTSNADFVQRLYAEGRAAGKLNHPNIVGALDVGQAGEFHYFVMEYVEGTTVYDELMEITQYDEEDAIRIGLQIASGLAHAHQAGIIHRDVKPQNIMLTREGIAKLADMGLAREAQGEAVGQDEEGKVMGTPNYVAPEQILNKHVDFRADLYSLGATLYFMVTGQVPFDAPSANGVMKKHLTAPLVPPEKRNPRVSQGLSQVIQVCMAKSPDDRYDTTEDLVADLEAISHGELPLRAQSKLGEQIADDEEPAATASAGGESGDPAVAELSHRHDLDAPPPIHEKEPLRAQPLFWIALAGWSLALLFLLLWLMK